MCKKKVEKTETLQQIFPLPLDPFEEKIETLQQIFPIPREILKDLLITYKGNVQEIVEKLL